MKSIIRMLNILGCTLMGWRPCVTCGRACVGYSRFCRRHTDEILNRPTEALPKTDAHEANDSMSSGLSVKGGGMSEDVGAPSEYGLVMPFVVVKSKGGPYEDDAFVAGWECGAVDAALHAAEHFHAIIKFTVHPANLPQLDLIAMQRGYNMETQDWGPGDWSLATFTKAVVHPSSDDFGSDGEEG